MLIAYSSAFALLSAIVDCVLLPEWIVAPKTLIRKPVVDCLVSHCRQRPECLVLLQLLVFWLLVSRTACSVEFP